MCHFGLSIFGMTRGLAIGLKQVVPPSWFRSLVFHVLLRYLPNTLQKCVEILDLSSGASESNVGYELYLKTYEDYRE